MSQTNMQRANQLLVFVMLIGLSMSRPNGSVDGQQETSVSVGESQLGLADSNYEPKTFPMYRPMQPLQYYTYNEPSSLDRYQLQFRSFYPNIPVMRSGNGLSDLPFWNQWQQMVQKRQTRYRQCYFNPISCFRK